jgi:hypothetical protein
MQLTKGISTTKLFGSIGVMHLTGGGKATPLLLTTKSDSVYAVESIKFVKVAGLAVSVGSAAPPEGVIV